MRIKKLNNHQQPLIAVNKLYNFVGFGAGDNDIRAVPLADKEEIFRAGSIERKRAYLAGIELAIEAE